MRMPLWNDIDQRDRLGPFDVIGDVHGCAAELLQLLSELGYSVERDAEFRAIDAHHQERTAVFVGDLVDRGPDSPGVLRLVMGMVRNGHALAVLGNHEHKLRRKLNGNDVSVGPGLQLTLSQLAQESADFLDDVHAFCHDMPHHIMLDGGKLVVAHAGLPEKYHGLDTGESRAYAIWGKSIGRDDNGYRIRERWADDYSGDAVVIYGHTPSANHEWVNNTFCADSGSVFGNKLTAVRYPECEVIAVPSLETWWDPDGRF